MTEQNEDDEDMTYDACTFDQRVTAKMARMDLEIHKLREEVEHLKSWVHQLLNPNEEQQS